MREPGAAIGVGIEQASWRAGRPIRNVTTHPRRTPTWAASNNATARGLCFAYGAGEADDEQGREHPRQYPQDPPDTGQPGRGHAGRIRSFGGLQAVHVAVSLRHLAPRLILHSCAPSSLPYPDHSLQRVAGPLVFGPRSQRLTWRLVRALTSSDRGLRAMMASLSTLPTGQWWDRWTPADRAAARQTFALMDSGSGFVTDVRQAGAARSAYREAVLRSVPCPTLVTGSRHDGGVAFRHAQDFVRTIPIAA